MRPCLGERHESRVEGSVVGLTRPKYACIKLAPIPIALSAVMAVAMQWAPAPVREVTVLITMFAVPAAVVSSRLPLEASTAARVGGGAAIVLGLYTCWSVLLIGVGMRPGRMLGSSLVCAVYGVVMVISKGKRPHYKRGCG